MTGADLHPNAIDGTTGTELSVASQAAYDGRYVRTIGGTITPTADSANTFKVTNAANNANLLRIDSSVKTINIFEQGGNIGDFFNIGSGGTFYNQSNGSTTVRSGFGGKTWSFRNSGNNANTLTIDYDTGNLTLTGGLKVKRTATAAAYTVLVTDYIVGVTSTSAARTITLPAAATATVGKTYIVKDESGAAATNNITVQGNAAEIIEGSNTKVINTNYGVLRLYTDGTSWFTF